ncbi:histidine--tRNA ligase [Candidatus Saccharibacteria bacterium]|nr:histidine--tRNA ligase [Candidatus Saccharibacteria bacterium]
MKKINTSPISGMQELLPATQAGFDNLKNQISDVYHRHGYLHIETPVIDRCEILLAKAGGDTEKQIYKVVKTAEAADGADQAMRFDHTVPLARYVVEHENDLAFPFKVTQIGRNFRGERAQKGRFREFYQCDVDVIGRGNLPIYYDADVIETLLDAFKAFGLKTPVLARINNRKIVSGLIKEYNLDLKTKEILGIIDHSEKIAPEKVVEALNELNIGSDRVEKILQFIEIRGNRDTVLVKLNALGIEDDTFEEGVKELDTVMGLLEKAGFGESISADMKIVRGLDYYTGTVFEFNLPEYPGIGSVCGGGRYENLASYFTEQKLPGVGGSIGLTRLFYVLNENNLLSANSKKPIDYAVIPVTDAEIEYAEKVAQGLREEGNAVMVVASGKKFGDKMKYAGNLASKGIVIGENEVRSQVYLVKDFK